MASKGKRAVLVIAHENFRDDELAGPMNEYIKRSLILTQRRIDEF